MPGGLSIPGAFSGMMVSFDMDPLAMGSRRVHLAFMYKWYGAAPLPYLDFEQLLHIPLINGL